MGRGDLKGTNLNPVKFEAGRSDTYVLPIGDIEMGQKETFFKALKTILTSFDNRVWKSL